MAQLRQDYQQFIEFNTEIVVVGPEDAASFRKYWLHEGLPFIGLPDPNQAVLQLYGQEVNLFKLGRLPAQLLIDRGGRIRFVYFGHSMADIPSTHEVLTLLQSLPAVQ